MARTIQQIKDAIRTQKNTDPNLNGTNYATLNFYEDVQTPASKVSTANLIAYLVAWAQNLQEQLWDVTVSILQNAANASVIGTAQWLQGKIFKFQYDLTVPQIPVVYSDYSVGYGDPVGAGQSGTPNTNYQIIKACALTANGARKVQVKVAKIVGGVLAPLTALEQSSLNSYIGLIKPVGISIIATSPNPDYIYIKATIVADAAYNPTDVKTNVIAAITNYLQIFSQSNFGGILYPSRMEDAIQAVAGVVSVSFQGFNGRKYSDTTVNESPSVAYQSDAGYGVPENSSGYDLTTSITIQ